MIVRCPACSSRFSLDAERLGGKKVTLRCQNCREVFKIEVPRAGLFSPDEILIAHSDRNLCETISKALSEEGFGCRMSHDGSEALRSMEAAPPHVLLIDVALPGLLAFEVVETVRSRPALESVKVILLSSVYSRTAYKRSPTSLYGADDYIEKHHIPDLLPAKIRNLLPKGADCGRREAREESQRGEDSSGRGTSDGVKSNIRQAEEMDVSPQNAAEAAEKARRLARIIVSDIALYHQDRVEEGVRTGKFFQLLAPEVEEGRRLFEERVAPEVRRQEDFLGEAFRMFLEKQQMHLRMQGEEEVV